jgi:hypothetical protein
MTEENLSKKGKLFKPRDAKLFKPRNSLGNTGGQFYIAKNPTYGAVFTYHLSDVPSTSKSKRMRSERILNKDMKDIPFPGYEKLAAEMEEKSASIILTIKDSDGNHIRNIKKTASKGSGKIAWNLRHKSYYPVRAGRSQSSWYYNPSGPYVTPGEYHAELFMEKDGTVEKLDGPISFNVKPLRKGTLQGSSYDEYNSFRTKLSSLYIDISKYEDEFRLMDNKIQILEKAAMQLETFSPEMLKKIADMKNKYNKLELEYESNPARDEIGEWDKVTLSTRIRIAMQGLSTSYGPTELNISNLDIAQKMFNDYKVVIESLKSELENLEKEVKDLNPPHISGSGIN